MRSSCAPGTRPPAALIAVCTLPWVGRLTCPGFLHVTQHRHQKATLFGGDAAVAIHRGIPARDALAAAPPSLFRSGPSTLTSPISGRSKLPLRSICKVLIEGIVSRQADVHDVTDAELERRCLHRRFALQVTRSVRRPRGRQASPAGSREAVCGFEEFHRLWYLLCCRGVQPRRVAGILGQSFDLGDPLLGDPPRAAAATSA